MKLTLKYYYVFLFLADFKTLCHFSSALKRHYGMSPWKMGQGA